MKAPLDYAPPPRHKRWFNPFRSWRIALLFFAIVFAGFVLTVYWIGSKLEGVR